MNLYSNIFLFVITILPNLIQTARILAIFPLAAKSHFDYNKAIMRSLHNAGHHITFITSFPWNETAANYTIIDSSFDSPKFVGETPISYISDKSIHSLSRFLISLDVQHCYNVMKIKEIQEALSTPKMQYDLLITELFFMFECYLPIAEKLGIPVIGTVPLKTWKPSDYVIGVPNNLASMPLEMINLTPVMTFTQRLQNVIYNLIFAYNYRYVVGNLLEEFYKQHFAEELLYKKKISLVFSNSHPILLSRSTPPNVIDIAGINIKEAQPLSKDLKKFIDEATNGVILCSFGSLVKSSSLPQSTRSAFVNAFASIPQRVIWKYDEPIDDLPQNVMLMEWIPQRDILEHENVKAFISHCGQNGAFEAIYTGTPLVATPLFTDQYTTATALESQGVAVYLDINTVTKDKITHLLDKIINDTTYLKNMNKLSQILRDKPMSPQQSVVYWTEYVLKYEGAPFLRTAALDTPLHQHLLLDVLLFVIFIISLVLYLIIIIFKKLSNISRIYKKSKINKEIKKNR